MDLVLGGKQEPGSKFLEGKLQKISETVWIRTHGQRWLRREGGF